MIDPILAKAAKKCDQAELYYAESHSLLSRSSLDKLEACKSAEDRGFGLRVVCGGRIGHSFFSREEDADRAISGAVKSAKLSHTEGYSLPGKASYHKRKCFDPKLKALDEEKLVDMVLASMDATAESADPIQAEVEARYGTVEIASTEGVYAKDTESLFSLYCVGKKKESMGDESFSSRKLTDCAVRVGRVAGELAEQGVGASPVDYEGTVTLHQDVIGSFFGESVVRNLNGELARRGKAKWADRLGKKVTGDFTLTDDPTIDWGIGTMPFDDEGVPTTKKDMIKNGVLKQFYYDTRTANLAGAKATGNGFRGGPVSPPTISMTNVVISPESRGSGGGMFVRDLMGYHNMNPVTGDFSLDITHAILNEKPVRGCVLTGNVFEMLEKGEWNGPTETRAWLTSPQLSFEAKVVGK
ncbi:MAG: TldD/PmbA family protein [Candidatus Diapherotrites archaeon]|nr:TldD/PmbA family protein [Candidatus Diapherotrites archaeon]